MSDTIDVARHFADYYYTAIGEIIGHITGKGIRESLTLEDVEKLQRYVVVQEETVLDRLFRAYRGQFNALHQQYGNDILKSLTQEFAQIRDVHGCATLEEKFDKGIKAYVRENVLNNFKIRLASIRTQLE